MLSANSYANTKLVFGRIGCKAKYIKIGAWSSLTTRCPPPPPKNPCGCGGSDGQAGGACGKVPGYGPGKGKNQMSYKPYVKPCYIDHDHKNMTLKRPMSPHLTIYGPTLPAMTSIAQRITGTVLSFYAVLLAGGALFLSNGIDTYVSMIQSLDMSRPLIILIKILVGAPFSFHYFNGIRFVLWNAGKMLNIKAVYGSAHKSFIAAGVMTFLFALL